ncbi:polysaccharide biosynthesis/export family protein [Tropicimonas sediminicola]|nr:polysaccharide biosynthesis/export family protein [Tropicimonas sediminicola]
MRVILALVAFVLGVLPAAAQGNYLIQPGDQLAVEILEDSTLNRQVLVLPDGKFGFPMVGAVTAAGRTAEQVERSIASSIASNFSVTPTVFVSVVGLAPTAPAIEEADNSFVVYLVGEVNAPGPKAVLPGTTVLQLLSQSGGFTKYAATKRLQLRREDANKQQRMYKINYRAISRGAEMTMDPQLVEGDVLLVPERRLFE